MRRRKFRPSALTQAAGRAFAAAVTPIVEMFSIPLVAGVRFFPHEIHERLAAQGIREFPRLFLGDIHQGRFNPKRFVHPERQRYLQALHRIVATVGIP